MSGKMRVRGFGREALSRSPHPSRTVVTRRVPLSVLLRFTESAQRKPPDFHTSKTLFVTAAGTNAFKLGAWWVLLPTRC
eukprot:192253-Amphidinium_carterae.1